MLVASTRLKQGICRNGRETGTPTRDSEGQRQMGKIENLSAVPESARLDSSQIGVAANIRSRRWITIGI